jgi:hypothetical protein
MQMQMQSRSVSVNFLVEELSAAPPAYAPLNKAAGLPIGFDIRAWGRSPRNVADVMRLHHKFRYPAVSLENLCSFLREHSPSETGYRVSLQPDHSS